MSNLSRHILKTLVSTRSFHLSRSLNIDPKTVEEVRIPVPWGHIAGKRWGEKTSQPVIAVHGLLDNSSSFDKLLPLLDVPSVLCLDLHGHGRSTHLPKGKRWGEKTGQPIIAVHGYVDNSSSFDTLLTLLDVPSVLCLDLHGHGKSSHLPKGIAIYYGDYLVHLRYLFKYVYKWEKDLVFLGHSLGSSLLFTYSALYPDEVSKMINIECGRMKAAFKFKTFLKYTRDSIDSFLLNEKDNQLNTFTFDECINHMVVTRDLAKMGVSKEKCKILASRGICNVGNGKYYFVHDDRGKPIGRHMQSFNLALASRIRCKVLNIRVKGVHQQQHELEEDKQIKIMRENGSSVFNETVEGARWGEKTGQPIIAVHGFLDNLSSFDTLLPLLDVPSVLCLDLHGHGESSHLPKGISIYYHDYLIQLRYLLKHLYKWDKDLVFLGHSFGSSLLFTYAALYPEEVSKMINIDCSRYRSASDLKKFIKDTRKSVDVFLNLEKDHKFDTYTFDECINHLFEARDLVSLRVSKDKCMVLASRDTANLGNGKYYFTHDDRLKAHAFARNTHAYNLALASRIRCKVLNIHASGGINVELFGIEEDKHMKVMSENCSSCLNLVLQGTHHMHLETPEVVAPHINKFLNS